MAVPFLLPGTAPPVKRQAPAGCGLPELAMIKYFSAVYAQSVSGGHFKSFSHHKEHNGIGWRTTQRGRNGGMEGRKRIAVVGSDARQAAAGRALARAGYAVAGAEQVARADVILLPLPLDESRTPLAQLLRAAKPGAFALGGRLSAQAVEIARQAGVELADYFARPELAVYNAIPTAEGCIGILLQQRTRTLWGAEVLVLGFGPVGQALAVRLSALGAGVTVCARRPEQRALAESLGLRAAPLTALAGLAPAFDTVVNTIPAPVLGDGVLARLRSGSLIVDLASKPGGTDFAAAARRGHRAIHAAGAGGEDTMITQNRGTIAFAVCGSFCTLEAALQSARALTAQGWQLLPVMSFAARQDTRFGTGNYWKEQLEAAAGHPVLDTLQAVEPLGPRKMAQALVVAPCTGATLSRLAAGLSDTPVTLAAKSLLRVGCPVVLAVSTNDGLGASGENIARLFQRKHYYFVPYGQDDPAAKPQSLKADFARLPAALEAALHGEQLQPVLLGQRERAMAFQPGQNVVY